MVNYVLGFAFATDGRVVLIRKNKPMWQSGKLNGVGGKIEEGETAIDAMIREFEEETGCRTQGWGHFCTMGKTDWTVVCYVLHELDINEVKTITDEEIIIVSKDQLPKDVINNLRWLIPMAWCNDCVARVAYNN